MRETTKIVSVEDGSGRRAEWRGWRSSCDPLQLGGNEVDECKSFLVRSFVEADEMGGDGVGEAGRVVDECEQLTGPEGGLDGDATVGGVFCQGEGKVLGIVVL